VFGTFPAIGAAMVNLEEVVVHSRDLASAVGRELTVEPGVGRLIDDRVVTTPLDDLLLGGASGSEAPASASIIDRLIGLLCRQP
jgi:hypothetical protein